jgi:acyl-CoA synthetase (AMP-forming)/AMP-acid ligase II
MSCLELPPIPPEAAATIGGFLRELAECHGVREAIAFHDPLRGGSRISWSYAELRRQARTVAAALAAVGIGKGERVGLLLGNRPEFAAAFFGAAMAGAMPVTLSTFATREELAVLLERADISLLLSQHRIATRDLAADLADLLPELADGVVSCEEFPFLRRLVLLEAQGDRRFESWTDFLAKGAAIAEAALDARESHVQPSDAGVVIYTSGTTSLPKGVIHRHSTLVSQFRWQAHICGRHQGVRVGSPFPLFWSAGLVSVLGSTLAAGGTYVAQEVFDPGATLALIASERINEWYGFPTHTAALAEHPDWPTADLGSLTRVKGNYEFDGHPGTNPDPNWHHVAATGYGMSESCTILTCHVSTTSLEVARRNAGLPLPGVELRIAAVEDGHPLGPNAVGEICARGPTLMPHYVGVSREDSFDADGFFHTGDLGFVDDEGHLHWTGRIKDMIKTGGANVAPSEIEEAAKALGSLKLCRAIGVADKRLGELVLLCAVREEGSAIGEEDVRSALRKRMAAYKVPRRVLFFKIEDYPLTASGKVRDDALRQLAAQRLHAVPA